MEYLYYKMKIIQDLLKPLLKEYSIQTNVIRFIKSCTKESTERSLYVLHNKNYNIYSTLP